MLNIRIRKRRDPVDLHDRYAPDTPAKTK